MGYEDSHNLYSSLAIGTASMYGFDTLSQDDDAILYFIRYTTQQVIHSQIHLKTVVSESIPITSEFSIQRSTW